MQTRDDGGSAMRAIAVAALALAGMGFALTPVAAYLDNTLLDAAWRILRRVDRLPAPDDIVIVGIDEASVGAIAEPPGLWHVALGEALRLAAARPRAPLGAFPAGSLLRRREAGRRSRALRWPCGRARSAPFVPRCRSARALGATSIGKHLALWANRASGWAWSRGQRQRGLALLGCWCRPTTAALERSWGAWPAGSSRSNASTA
jgi:hypothetical protein